jgi:hypothetical protein
LRQTIGYSVRQRSIINQSMTGESMMNDDILGFTTTNKTNVSGCV